MTAERISIGYFGDGIWAHEAFKLLVADTAVVIRFVCLRSGSQDAVLSGLAEKHGVPVLKHPNINSSEFIARVRAENCDLLVSMSFNQIFSREIIDIRPRGIINCHAGKLPFYRGRNILNWVLINDEKEFGITVHYVDEGIDTGDILAQECLPITDADDYSTLLIKAHAGCAQILYRTITDIRLGRAVARRQVDIHPIGFYCGLRRAGDEMIDWSCSSREVFNLVRAVCRPGPQALSTFAGQDLRINRVSLIPGAPAYRGIPGQVVGKTAGGLVIKTGDTTVEVIEYDYALKIRIGDRLGRSS